MFRPTIVSPPDQDPVTLHECKQNGVIDYSSDDALIEQMIKAAVSHLDGFQGVLGRCIVTQTWTVEQPCLERDFVLCVPDVSSVVINYLDTSGASQVLPAQHIEVHPVHKGTRIAINREFDLPDLSDDSEAPVSVEFTAGFGGPSMVPWALKLAIMQLVRQMYDDRTGQGALEMSSMVKRLIFPYRWVAS